jgi:hypothetical protein
MKLRHVLAALAILLCAVPGLPQSARAASAEFTNSAAESTVAGSSIEISPGMGNIGLNAIDVRPPGEVIGYPAPLPGILLFAATGFMYLWQRRFLARQHRGPAAAAFG